MAILTIQGSTNNLRTIKILRPCLGPGGAVLTKGQTVKVPEADAQTLVGGDQAKFVEESKEVDPATDPAK